jgi:hypothetical protein
MGMGPGFDGGFIWILLFIIFFGFLFGDVGIFNTRK